jgi:hypothetical protein
MTTDYDDLFAPSLSQTERRELPDGERPWRLNSQAYVAFFGGPLAAATIAFLNGRRLGLGTRSLAAIAVAGVAAFVAAIVLVATLDSDSVSPRILVAASGIAAFLAMRQLQHGADRRYSVGQTDDSAYDSLVRIGLLVTVVAGLASAAVLVAVAA